MLGLAAHQIIVLAMAALVAWAAFKDALTMTIPNRIVIGIVALFPAWLILQGTPIDGLWSLSIAAGVLAAGFAAFSFGFIGGGDAKLLAAVSLWAGPTYAVEMLAITAILGGGLATVCFVTIAVKRRLCPARGDAIAVETPISQLPIPYGVAIALGGLYVALRLLAG